MKTVCFVNSQGYNAFKNKSVGGTQLQLRNISRRLARKYGFEVKFITRCKNGNEVIDGVELIDGIGEVNGFFNKLKSAIKMFKAMKQADADIYFSSNSNMEVALVALFCMVYRKKHITRTVHEKQINPKLVFKRGLKGIVNHLGLRKADKILVQSEEHKKALKNWFNPNITILRNLFDIESKKYQKGDHILWVGRRVKWKRPDLFLDLAEEFSSEEFIMIAPKVNSNELNELIEDRASSIPNLKLIERVPRKEIQKYFDGAKIFVNTSENEGFPNTFVEAGKGYTPILSYKVDPDNFIEEKNCGLSSNGKYSELKENMVKLVENDEIRDKKARNCRNYVEKNHDIEKNIKLVIKSINRLN